jgi:hypothetical protein
VFSEGLKSVILSFQRVLKSFVRFSFLRVQCLTCRVACSSCRSLPSQTGSHLGRDDDPKRCNQIKIMPFIHTSVAQSESASPKATTLYVYNMSLFLVACLLNRWQRASSARCLQNKARCLTTPRSSKPPSPNSADVIGAEIEVSQRCALCKHSCKALCPACSDQIPAEIEVD